MLDKKLLQTTLPNPDERAAQYRATNPLFQPMMAPPGNKVDAGWLAGYKDVQNIRLKQNEDVRQQGLLDIASHGDVRQERTSQQQAEAFDWKRQDVNRQNAIQAGMSEAAQMGGFDAVVDYLTKADPDRAIEFASKKNGLDQAMLKTETLQSLLPVQQAEALAEGYGVMGKMGMALLKAPEEDRRSMYKTMLPMLKKINPDAPDSLDNDAVNMFMLAASQAMPANVMYQTDKKLDQYKSSLGQKMGDYQRAVEQYGDGSPQAEILKNSIYNDSINNGMTAVQKAHLDLQKSQNGVMGENQLRQEFTKNSKDFNSITSYYQTMMSAAKDSLTQDGKLKGPDDLTVIYNYGKMLDANSNIMPGEYAEYSNTTNWPDAMRVKYNKLMKDGGKLSDAQRNAFMSAATTTYESKKRGYDTLKAGYSEIATKRGYDPQNIFMDASPMAQMTKQDASVPAELQRTAMKYVAQGMDPKVADGIVKDIMSKQQQAQSAPVEEEEEEEQVDEQNPSSVTPMPVSRQDQLQSVVQGLRQRQAGLPQPGPRQLPHGTYQPME